MNSSFAADTILFNGTVSTMDNQKTNHEAIAIKNGDIVALGNSKEIVLLANEATTMINLQGRTALPGFIESHQHLFATGAAFLYLNCKLDSIEAVVAAVRKKSQECGENDWIIGTEYYEGDFKEKRNLSKWDFADIKQPVLIIRYCHHTGVVNERVLKMMGINEHSVIPDGIIVRNQKGEATGVLQEKAFDEAKKLLPAYTDELLIEAAKAANHYYIRNGITSVHEAGMGIFSGSLLEFDILQQMARDRELDVRIYSMILHDFFEQARDMKLLTGFGNDHLMIGSIKIFYDGTMGGSTAYVTKPYQGTDQFGLTVIPKAELEESVLKAHQAGFQIAIHAMGDQAISDVIDTYEKALQQYPRSNHRHRIEHASIMNKSLIEKMARLGIIPTPTIPLVYTTGDAYLKTLNPDLRRYVYPNRTFFEQGIKPAGNSDSPVTPVSPFLGMYTAMTRRTKGGQVIAPEEAITLEQALEMYTINAAHASFEENRKGSLEIGKVGDLVVVEKGFMSFTADEVKDTEVDMTIIGGKVVYTRES